MKAAAERCGPECRVRPVLRAAPAPGKLWTWTAHPGPWLARVSTCVWFCYSEHFHRGLCTEGTAETQRRAQRRRRNRENHSFL